MNEYNTTKQVSLTQIQKDLASGLTKWKKDDIGFGSLEKKYQLTLEEMVTLTGHPKVKMMETRIPTFVIVDDLPNAKPVQETRIEAPVTGFAPETVIEVEQPRVIQTEEPFETAETKVETASYKQPTSLATFI